jgi:dolichol-phosphate mannosyltransferase
MEHSQRRPEERRTAPSHSVILPVYNEAEGLAEIVGRVERTLEEAQCVPYEILVVDDGSTDDSWDQIAAISGPRDGGVVRGLGLSRNFGHQIAVYAGIQASTGSRVAVLDCDGQDPPELLGQMFARLDEGFDAVNAVRRRRRGSILRRLGYFAFYRLFSRAVPFPVPLDSGDFCVMGPRVAETIRRSRLHNPFIRGVRSWIGGRQVDFPYPREDRQFGKSKYGFIGLVWLGAPGITSFSKVPLRMAVLIGGLIALTSICYTATIVVMKLLLGYPDFSGWASLASLVTFLGGVQLMTIGVVGEYVGHIFDSVRGMPAYVIHEHTGFDDSYAPPGGFPGER